MKKHYIILIGVFVVILVAGFAVYIKMGGYAKPEITVNEYPATYIKGQKYDGILRAKEFGQLFADYAKKINDKKETGLLAAYYFNEPEKSSGKVDAIVGVLAGDSIPAKNEMVYKIPSKKVIITKLKAHFAFASGIYEDTDEFAEKNKLKINKKGVIEIYPSDQEVVLISPIQE